MSSNYSTSKLFYGKEIFNSNYFSFATPIYEFSALFSAALTSLLIYLIITQTPKEMKSFRTYLLPYAVNHLLVEILMALMAPAMLHPFLYVVPLGPAKWLPPNIFFLMIAGSGYFISTILDCTIAMNLERYFAMKILENRSSKIPIVVFAGFQGASLLSMGFMTFVTFYPPLYEALIIPSDKVSAIIESKISGLGKIVDVSKIIIFHTPIIIPFPILPLIWMAQGGLRVMIAMATLLLNAKASHSLPTSPQNYNRSLLRFSYIQFFGIAGIIFFCVSGSFALYLFVPTPSILVNLGILAKSYFCMYDTAVTLFFIKPYRKSCIAFVKGFF